MPKYTPGPWGQPHFCTDDSDCNCGYIFGGSDDDPITVCLVYKRDQETDNLDIDQAKANAKLIAAAPELLEALRVASSALHVEFDGYPNSEVGRLVKAAIEKAEG